MPLDSWLLPLDIQFAYHLYFMTQTAPIVVGIDFSDSSGFVLRQAVHAGQLSGSPVIAVHVLNRGKLLHWAKEHNTEALMNQAEEKLKALAEEEVPGAELAFEICVGRPYEELARITKAYDASRLVIAANERAKTQLGSIASRCVRTVPSDVLIVRDWLSGNFNKVVVCTDFSARSNRLIEKAIEIATVNDAALDIVHVIYPPDKDYWGKSLADPSEDGPSYEESIRADAKAKMDHCLAGFEEQTKDINCSGTILESTTPSVELTYHISESGADLVVLGTRGHSKLASIFVGTNAERLMHDVTVSVLAARV